jgi:hypothetical protein
MTEAYENPPGAPRVATIICTEPAIEKQSVLLARSIRRFGGRLIDAPIYSFSPRGQPISAWAQEQLSQLRVSHDCRLLNHKYPYDPFANKISACACAEVEIEADVFVFLDSDKVVFNNPAALLISDAVSAAVRPVDHVNIGVNRLEGGQNERYWRALYDVCGVTETRFVRTTIAGSEILQYFQGGMIAVHRNSHVFTKWAHNFDRIMRSGITPTEPHLMEQSALAATVSSLPEDALILPLSYNYPIHAQSTLMPPLYRLHSFEGCISIHYHHSFDNGGWRPFLEDLWAFDRKSERYRWLVDSLRELKF